MEIVGGIREISPMSTTVKSILEGVAAECGFGVADRPDSVALGRGL